MTSGGARARTRGGPAAAGPLLERDAELAELEAALAAADSGEGRLLLIEGAAGIGKSRLLGEAAELAERRGQLVLRARGGELERDFGFGVVRQLLESELADAAPARRRALLEGAAGFAEAVLASPASEAIGPSSESTHGALHGLYWLLSNLAADSSVLVSVDDLQWADEPSLRFLLYLSRRLRGLRVTVVLGRRTGGPEARSEALETLLVDGEPIPLRPEPLSAAAAGELARALLGAGVEEPVWIACHEATGGNAFLLVELLHELRAGGEEAEQLAPEAVRRLQPSRIAAAILLRIGRLDPAAPALARAIAVLGEEADAATAAALAELELEPAIEVIDLLADARVLDPRAPLRFIHPIVRRAIYEDMPRAERTGLHSRAARLLGEQGRGSELVAIHLLATEPAGEAGAVVRLREAARESLSRGAPEAASRYLRRAIAEPPAEAIRLEVLLELGSAAARCGEADAVDLLRRVLADAGGRELGSLAALELGAMLLWTGATEEAIEALESTLETEIEPERRTALEALLLLAGLTTPAAHDRLADRLREARARIDRVPVESARPLLSQIAGDVLISEGDGAEAARLAAEALGRGDLPREDIARTGGMLSVVAITTLTYAGRLAAARRAASELLELARAQGSPVTFARASAARASIRARAGDLIGAEADARASIELSAEPGRELPHPYATAVLAAVLVERDQSAAARAALRETETQRYDPDAVPLQELRSARARLLLAEDDPQAALEELERYAGWAASWGGARDLVPVAWRSEAALAHLALGRRDRALELAERELEDAERLGVGIIAGGARRALGLVADGARGAELLSEAVATLEGTEARLEHARALVDLGACLRRAGKRSAAIEALGAGMDRAHHLRAERLVRRARGELRLAGARPSRPALSGRDALTPAEDRVAAMAAEGMRNKEIAQALFVTLRTVEMHLSNAYGKLRISSREELAAALERE